MYIYMRGSGLSDSWARGLANQHWLVNHQPSCHGWLFQKWQWQITENDSSFVVSEVKRACGHITNGRKKSLREIGNEGYKWVDSTYQANESDEPDRILQRHKGKAERKEAPKQGRNTRKTDGSVHRIPESLSAFCNIVSWATTNTSRIFVVSVACVKLTTISGPANDGRWRTYCGYTVNRALFACMNLKRMYLAALLISEPPEYSGK